MTQSQFAVCSSSQPLLMSKLDWFQIRHCSGRKRTFPPNPSCLGWTIFLSGFKNFCPTIQQKVCPVLYLDYQNCFLPFFLRFFVVFFVNVCVLLQNLFESVLMKRLVGEWGCKWASAPAVMKVDTKTNLVSKPIPQIQMKIQIEIQTQKEYLSKTNGFQSM